MHGGVASVVSSCPFTLGSLQIFVDSPISIGEIMCKPEQILVSYNEHLEGDISYGSNRYHIVSSDFVPYGNGYHQEHPAEPAIIIGDHFVCGEFGRAEILVQLVERPNIKSYASVGVDFDELTRWGRPPAEYFG